MQGASRFTFWFIAYTELKCKSKSIFAPIKIKKGFYTKGVGDVINITMLIINTGNANNANNANNTRNNQLWQRCEPHRQCEPHGQNFWQSVCHKKWYIWAIGRKQKSSEESWEEFWWKKAVRRVGLAYRELIGSLYESWTIGIERLYKQLTHNIIQRYKKR